MKLQRPRNYDFRVSEFDPPRSQSGNDRERRLLHLAIIKVHLTNFHFSFQIWGVPLWGVRARVVFSSDFPRKGFLSLATKKRVPGTPFTGKKGYYNHPPVVKSRWSCQKCLLWPPHFFTPGGFQKGTAKILS